MLNTRSQEATSRGRVGEGREGGSGALTCLPDGGVTGSEFVSVRHLLMDAGLSGVDKAACGAAERGGTKHKRQDASEPPAAKETSTLCTNELVIFLHNGMSSTFVFNVCSVFILIFATFYCMIVGFLVSQRP